MHTWILLCRWDRVPHRVRCRNIFHVWCCHLLTMHSAPGIVVPSQLYKRDWRALPRWILLSRRRQRIASMQYGHVQRFWGHRVQQLRVTARLLLSSPVQECNGRGMHCG